MRKAILPQVPPPDLEKITQEGIEEAEEYCDCVPRVPSHLRLEWRPVCPWPLYSAEGEAWRDGFNGVCIERRQGSLCI
jgi:hypothetical protein